MQLQNRGAVLFAPLNTSQPQPVSLYALPSIKQSTQLKLHNRSHNIDKLTITECIELVADLFGLKPKQVMMRCRMRHIVTARHTAIWLLKKYTALTLTAIAEGIGNMDHTTVIYAIKKIDDLIDIEDPLVISKIREAQKRLCAIY